MERWHFTGQGTQWQSLGDRTNRSHTHALSLSGKFHLCVYVASQRRSGSSNKIVFTLRKTYVTIL